MASQETVAGPEVGSLAVPPANSFSSEAPILGGNYHIPTELSQLGAVDGDNIYDTIKHHHFPVPEEPSSTACCAKPPKVFNLPPDETWRDLLAPYVAEFLGTFTLTLFGIMSVASGVLAGALVGTGQVAVVWGIGVALSIYTTANVSGAHLNPAISFMFAVFNKYSGFRWSKLPGYIVAQFLGSFVAGFVNWALYFPYMNLYDSQKGIVRGSPESVRSAMSLPQFYPNPAVYYGLKGNANPNVPFPAPNELINTGSAFFAEALGTGILAYVIVALVDRCNTSVSKTFVPMLIGLTVTALICTLSPISQAGFNPARDFGPRIVAYIAGWDGAAWEGWWVYIVAPFVGAPIGAGIWLFCLRRPDDSCLPHEKCE